MEMGDEQKGLRKKKNHNKKCCKVVFACFNPVYKISELNQFKMHLNSRDKAKSSFLVKGTVFLFCQCDF